MHRLLKRQIKQVYGKDFDLNSFDEKTLLLIANVTEVYQNFDEEKAFLNHTVKENKKAIEEAYKNLLSSSRLAAIGEMMENITHQWKQPLSIILNIVSLLKLDLKENKELDIIEKQTLYLNNTIVDFTNFSSHSEQEKKTFELNKSIEETIDIFNFQAEVNNIKIKKVLEKELFIQGDIGKFNQALLVLFSNAKDAFLSQNINNRVIEIKSEVSNGELILRVQDNAGGIPSYAIDKVFEPYFTTKFKDKGTGIGLSITYNIIEKMKGVIQVENYGAGALFTIKIPQQDVSKDLEKDVHG
ncbi:MAG: Histidine kinase [uncultured Sulfurovum sp.]|uniref:histidine kinase n=1 Tax=uncultured Sulfurovum sp. TaxID=269237 RepID=A0A6S6S4B0_9BACT|nr:MAG: Histidine kinase [uncultured Sulfurovum sp.]